MTTEESYSLKLKYLKFEFVCTRGIAHSIYLCRHIF